MIIESWCFYRMLNIEWKCFKISSKIRFHLLYYKYITANGHMCYKYIESLNIFCGKLSEGGLKLNASILYRQYNAMWAKLGDYLAGNVYNSKISNNFNSVSCYYKWRSVFHAASRFVTWNRKKEEILKINWNRLYRHLPLNY